MAQDKQEHQALIQERNISASDLGILYKYVNKRFSNESKITSIKDVSGNDLTEDKDIANALNDYFASVGAESNHHMSPFPNINVPQLNNIHIEVKDVGNAITKLKIISLLVPMGYYPYSLRVSKIL